MCFNLIGGVFYSMSNLKISEDRLHHILSVARECYQIAKDKGYDESFCRRMFMIGWNYDVGYEFSEKQEEHSIVSAEMLNTLKISKVNAGQRVCHAIEKHGQYTQLQTIEWKILNIADMTIDSKGNKVDVTQRLDDIKNRYGECSNQYLTACDLAYVIGLTEINLSENIL